MSSAILKKIRCAKTLNGSLGRIVNRTRYSTAPNVESNASDDIIIPARIPRGPADILEAIASTIGRDPTASHYKYHDDPYLIPMSNYKKRVYALAQESGRKAAIWVRQQNGELFTTRESDPPLRIKYPYVNADPLIEAYIPTPIYDENSLVTEEDLLMAIQNIFVDDAITIYNLIESKSPGSLQPDTQLKLLELLCFYNEKNPISKEWLEEKWFRNVNINQLTKAKTWKNNGLAMKIFSNMKEKTSAAYCALIQGMCKYGQADTAYELYQECRQNNLILNSGIYNGLLSSAGFLKENNELQWQLIRDILADMKSQNISPDLGTLNSILESLSHMDTNFSKKHCTSVLAEFTNVCGIEPSLATWFYILSIYYKDKNNKNNVLHLILDKIEGQNLKIQDPNDILFFMTAMNICRYSLMDIQLAHRLHNILLYGSNYDLIGDSHRESVYYRYYFSLICRNEPFDKLMEMYENLVPHVYVPESNIMEEVLKAVDLNIAYEYYPLLWSHIQLFAMLSKKSLIQYLLQSMARNIPPELMDETSTEQKKSVKLASNDSLNLNNTEVLSSLSIEDNFARVAWDIWEKIQDWKTLKNDDSYWTAGMLSDLVLLLTKGNRINDAYVIIQYMTKMEGIGVPASPESLLYFARTVVKNGYPSYSYGALKYLSNCGYPEALDTAMEVLQTILNRPQSEIEELINQALIKGTKEWTADSTVINLVQLVSQNKTEPSDVRGKNVSSINSSSSSDSDSTSDSDEENKNFKK